MKSLTRLLPFLLLALSPFTAAGIDFCTTKQPHYLKEDLTGNARIKIVDVPCVMEPPSSISMLGVIDKPFIPLTDGTWKTPHDVNLISLYGIKIGCTIEINGSVSAITADIDASNAKVPEDYPFTIDQVVEAARSCIEQVYPVNADNGVEFGIKIIPPVAEATPAK